MSDSRILYTKDIKKMQPDFSALKILSRNIAETTETVILNKQWKNIALLTTNNNPNLYHQVVDKLEAQNYTIESFFTDDDWIDVALEWYDQMEAAEAWKKQEYSIRHTVSWQDAFEMIKDTFAQKEHYSENDFINELIRLSYQVGASDVHFQAEEVWVVMRIRVDGILQTAVVFGHIQFKKYLMKIKYISGLKMNLWYTSQDWRFDFPIFFKWKQLKIDVRVSVMPWLRWESIVLRFLDASKWIMEFNKLWCEKFHIDLLNQEIKRNFWLILVTWPTWSWKTTTVYSLLNAVNAPEKKLITLEDPVEYELPWIEQSQIDEKKWYSFEAWLKWVLRHDPDIIMVWEIRTLASAEMAVNAALTWHLVISTLHTNSAPEAITRLLNMGVKPFMLSSALNCIISQRLLRKIAKPKVEKADKHIEYEINEAIDHIKKFQPWIQINYDWNIYQPDKRVNKFNSWYQWRTAVFEILQINQVIKDAILSNKSIHELEMLAKKHWFLSLKDAAYLKMLKWVTSYEEILRMT